MAISSVQIGNLALGKIGTDTTIESLTENSSEAKTINLWFDLARQEVLSGFAWGFATERLTLATHTDDPSAEWTFRYQYPVRSLAFRFIAPVIKTDDPIPFSIELSSGTKSILTDATEAIGAYTIDVTDTSLYTPWFIETFTTLLSSHIALAVTGQPELALSLGEAARVMMIRASALDATEKAEDPARNADHIRGRA